jgi:hypothetical protein
MFIPDLVSEFFHPDPGYKVKQIPDPDPHLRIKVFLTPKLFLYNLSEK